MFQNSGNDDLKRCFAQLRYEQSLVRGCPEFDVACDSECVHCEFEVHTDYTQQNVAVN